MPASPSDQDGPYLVIIGDPVAGFEFFGPFADYDQAERFAGERTDTWTTHLKRPEKDEATGR